MLGETNQIFGLIRLAKWIGSFWRWLRKPPLPVKRTLIEAKEFEWGGLRYRSFKFEQIEPPSDDSPTGRTIEQA